MVKLHKEVLYQVNNFSEKYFEKHVFEEIHDLRLQSFVRLTFLYCISSLNMLLNQNDRKEKLQFHYVAKKGIQTPFDYERQPCDLPFLYNIFPALQNCIVLLDKFSVKNIYGIH